MSETWRRLAPAVLAGAVGALSAATVGLAWFNGQGLTGFAAGNEASTWLAGLGFGLLAALVLRDQPTNRLGVLLTVGSLCAAVSALGGEYADTADRYPGLPAAALAAWAATTLWLPAFVLLLFGMPLLFPDGRPASARWRMAAWASLIAGLVGWLSLTTTQRLVHDAYPQFDNPFDIAVPEQIRLMIGEVGLAVSVLVGAAATVSIVLRMRGARSPQRQQHAWYVLSILLAVVFSIGPWPEVVGLVGNLLAVAALGVGIVRYGLFDIQVLLSRTLAYALLAAAAIGLYVGAAALLGVRPAGGAGPLILAAVAVVCVAAMSRRLQRGVERLLFGDQAAPFAALTTLGSRLGGALSIDTVLPTVLRTVRESLRVPYVAICWPAETTPRAVDGTPVERTVSFPLAHAGEDLGALVVGLRPGEKSLSTQDERLLAAFVQQVGVAVHDVKSTEALQRSRELLVLAREEERRRLRRDLHDGLGPALAGITLGLESAAKAVDRGDGTASGLLVELRAESAGCVDDVRRIVADLRPPVLDEIGLAAALRDHAARLGRSSLRIEVAERGDRQPMPAAVELAAYRIASEALANAVRHSAGTRCELVLEYGAPLRVSVVDDGTGLPGPRRGQGLESMRERAEELGGTCAVIFTEGVGTRVEATLPVGPR